MWAVEDLPTNKFCSPQNFLQAAPRKTELQMFCCGLSNPRATALLLLRTSMWAVEDLNLWPFACEANALNR